jgi:O-antigen/teichoic acid export membrane protein
MESNSLSKKTISAIAWVGSLQLLTQALNFAIGILLARLLTPSDFGLVAMVFVVIGFSQLLTDFGLSSAIIQRKNISDKQVFSSFVVSCWIGLFFTIAMAASSSTISSFYGDMRLITISLALAPIFFINAMTSIPKALLVRDLRHKVVSIVDMFSTLLGALVALLMALKDFGFWALVAQQLVFSSSKCLLLIYLSGLKVARINLSSVKELLGFSANVFSTQFLQQVSLQSDKIILGKYLSPVEVGLYSRAYQLTSFPIRNIATVIGSVMFPSLSKIQDDKAKVREVYFKVIGLIGTITFPMLIGLASLSYPLVSILLGEQWIQMTTYFTFFSLIGMIVCIATITGSFYLSQGKANLQLKINLISQPTQVVALLIGIQFGVFGLLCAYAFSKIFAALLTWHTLGRILNFKLIDVFVNLLKPIFCALLLYFAIFYLQLKIGFTDDITEILVVSVFGFLVYVILNVFIRNSHFFYIVNLIKNRLMKRKVV